MKYLSTIVTSLVLTLSVIAQDNCSVFVTEALATVENICDQTGRNELCYGNTQVSVTSTANGVEFSHPGDIVSVVDVTRIHTSPYSEPDEWGVALMRIQANVPDTLPGQNVTFLLFGETTLINDGKASVTLSGSTTASANVRSGPSANFSIADSLQSNTSLNLIGRNALGDWVYFTSDNSSGWLFASLLQIEGDVMTLDEVADNYTGSPSAGPMQAIYFTSGIGGAICNELSQDGLLIQSPESNHIIELSINDVDIQLGSTIYLQAEAGGMMTIYVLEGFAIVTANGETVHVFAGAKTTIPVDDELHPTGGPSEPVPYTMEEVESAPTGLLVEEFEIAEPTSEESLSGYHVVVPGPSIWVDTRLELVTGQAFTISATGEINICGTGNNPNCTGDPLYDRQIAPDGRVDVLCEGQFGPCQLMPANYGSLIGRIGNASPFFIGTGGEFVANTTGRLQLGVNDSKFWDNTGAYIVSINAG